MKIEEKKKILKVIFEKTEKMDEVEKYYLIGYIQGFNDKKNIDRINKNIVIL